jgi:hypothetical protein
MHGAEITQIWEGTNRIRGTDHRLQLYRQTMSGRTGYSALCEASSSQSAVSARGAVSAS